jgi:hypothetical protein
MFPVATDAPVVWLPGPYAESAGHCHRFGYQLQSTEQ